MSGGLEEFVKVYPEMCEGPGVEALIQAKEKLELLKKDGKYIYLVFSGFERNE